MTPTAVVIGAGINGLCVADGLLQRGWRVRVADRGRIPNPLSASYDRHRIIRTHYAGQPFYCSRVEAALSAWDALWDRLGANYYQETGTISLSSTPGDWTDRARDIFDKLSVPYIYLTPAELARRYPFLNIGDVSYGLATERGGVLFADAILQDLVLSLKTRGAEVFEGFEADTVDCLAAQVCARDGRVLQGDILVAAMGTGTGAFFGEMLGEQLTPMRSIVLYVAPPPSWSPSLGRLPCWISLGGEDGLWGVPPIAGIPMKIGSGRETRPCDPSAGCLVSKAEVDRIVASYRTRFAEFRAARVLQGIANFWTMAPGERFIFRQVERCFIVAACSGHGFKFGALTGQDVAEAITTGQVEAATRLLAGLEALSTESRPRTCSGVDAGSVKARVSQDPRHIAVTTRPASGPI